MTNTRISKPGGRRSDIWNDSLVLFYLKYKTYPPNVSESEKSRIRKRAKSYAFEGSQLIKIGSRGDQRRIIPRFPERLAIVNQLHRRLHHRKDKCMLNYLRTLYFWDHMAEDVQTVVKSCSVCQQMKSRSYVELDKDFLTLVRK